MDNMTKINQFLLEEDKLALGRDTINVDLSHEDSILLNINLLGIISDIKFYLDNVNLNVVTDEQIITDLKSIWES